MDKVSYALGLGIGRQLSQEDAQQLETIWASFLKKNEDRIDGETFNVNKHVTFDNL